MISHWLIRVERRNERTNRRLPHCDYETRPCCLQASSPPPPSLFLFQSRSYLSKPCRFFKSWGRGSHGSHLQPELFVLLRRRDPSRCAMWRLIFLAALAGFSRASDVLEFTDDDFESRIGDHAIILVEFFAPWWVSAGLIEKNCVFS